MNLKPVFLFLSGCALVLFSLDAIAEEASYPFEATVGELIEKEQTATQVKKASELVEKAAHCNIFKENFLTAPTKPKSPSTKAVERSNLSFNFIHYILYKWKYVDTFQMPPSEMPIKSKNSSPLSFP